MGHSNNYQLSQSDDEFEKFKNNLKFIDFLKKIYQVPGRHGTSKQIFCCPVHTTGPRPWYPVRFHGDVKVTRILLTFALFIQN